jgi:uncharacterized protein
MSMKRAIIIHCWEGYPEYCWYPQTKKELEEVGYTVEVPLMPTPDAPELLTWLSALQAIIGEPDEELWLIGHSIGTVTIMRYLETLPEGKKVGGVVLVAGYTESLGFKELENFFPNPLNFNKIKNKSEKFVLIHSDNDPFVPIQYGHRLKEELGAQLIIKPGMKHFSGPVDNEESCVSLPEVAEVIKAS